MRQRASGMLLLAGRFGQFRFYRFSAVIRVKLRPGDFSRCQGQTVRKALAGPPDMFRSAPVPAGLDRASIRTVWASRHGTLCSLGFVRSGAAYSVSASQGNWFAPRGLPGTRSHRNSVSSSRFAFCLSAFFQHLVFVLSKIDGAMRGPNEGLASAYAASAGATP